MGATIHAYGVCDDEEYFYNFIDGIYKDLGATPDRLGQTLLSVIPNPNSLERAPSYLSNHLCLDAHQGQQHQP